MSSLDAETGAQSDPLPSDDASRPNDDAGALDAAGHDASMSAVRWDLVRHPAWIAVAPAEDPFADAPPLVDCDWRAAQPELLGDEQVFSVDTGSCNYVTVRQPALLPVAVGEVIRIRLWHFDLSAPEPAMAHAAVTVDGLSVLDERISIPAEGGLLIRELRVTRAIAAGAPVLFHLHNHGANSWSLVEVSKGPG